MKATLIILFAAVVGVYGDASNCGTANGICGTNGKCETECVASNAKTGTATYETGEVVGNLRIPPLVDISLSHRQATPTCTPDCSVGEECSWKCEERVGADVCVEVDNECGTKGKCVTECSANPNLGAGSPTCDPECTGNDQSCSWKCQEEIPKSGTSRPSIFLPLTFLGILLRIHYISE